MFKLKDGREHLYQWDLNQQLIIEDNTIQEVHFSNHTDDIALVVAVKDNLANIPNILLQSCFDIHVFAYDGEATRYDKIIKVKNKEKPSDYTYTETEIKSYEYLEKKLNEIEEKGWSEEIVSKSVTEYMMQHPLSIYDDGQGNVFIETVPNGQELKY